jgi:hypothetical protein
MKINRLFMILSLVVMLVLNVLANALPINGLTTGEISDRIPDLVCAGRVCVLDLGVDLPGADCIRDLHHHP